MASQLAGAAGGLSLSGVGCSEVLSRPVMLGIGIFKHVQTPAQFDMIGVTKTTNDRSPGDSDRTLPKGFCTDLVLLVQFVDD